jgi:formylglycine-generating enzyme required for sulfatase activity
MPVDFTQIKSGEDFELLCEDLLRAMGFTIVQSPARGSDAGVDLIVSETVKDTIGFTEERKSLVQCKHYAHSGKAVPFADVANYREAMDQARVRRYLLITSTLPSQDLQNKFKAVSEKGEYVALIWSRNHLARFLDAHLDVRDRHFPPPPGPTPADALAQAVEGLLTVMGFTCQERQPAGDRVRLVCTSKAALTRPVAVVCREGTVTRDDVEALLANVRSQEMGGGVLVTHARVSPAARERATETGGLVRTFTLDEFYRELIDFEPYVRRLVADYEKDELSTYYVDLGCQSGDGSAYKPMDGYVDRWLDDPARNHISILGDYGTGKTSFCRQYAARLGRRWLADPDHHRIPILISLRDYAKAVSLKQLVTDFLVNRYSIQAGYEPFRRFNADGKLLLLFDGFDEMAQKVDYQTTVDNFEELARAVEAQSKVLLTCRTPYFRTRAEAEKLLSTRGLEPLPAARDLPERAAIDLTERPNFEIVHLLAFQKEDIQAMLRARFPGAWQGYWQRIEDTYNLAELAQRPVLLDMIARSLPHLKPGQALNAARLYEAYTDLWLLWDEEKGRRLITRADKRLFMQELALEMLRREEWSVHYSRLPERVRAHFRLEKAREIDYFEHDIRTCSFLNRDGEGNYRFVHKSLGEFFVAQWLAPKLLDGSAPEMRINEEVRGFVHGLLAEEKWPPPPPPGVVVPEGMAWVPPGPFIMGGGYGLPVKVARIEQGFFIARTPVTNAQYARFVAATGHEPPRHWGGNAPPDKLRFHPVVYVGWDDATAYAAWAAMRLPTRHEWEKAARGIDGRIYPWGDEFDAARCIALESDIRTTTPVGRYSPGGDSPCGCTDMMGNVYEWIACEGESGLDYHTLCGAAFSEVSPMAHCAWGIGDQGMPWDGYGFRLVVSCAPG